MENTLNNLLPVLYIVTLTICALSFSAIFLTILYNSLKTIKSFLF